MVAAASVAVAASGWLVGSPAPQSVVTNFGSHAPQLGSKANASGSVLVAKDGEVNLYAATASDGGYCIQTTTPWNPASTNQGGDCAPAATVDKPLVAFPAGSGPVTQTGFTAVFAGRTTNPAVNSVSITTPDGSTVTRPIGQSGFFVAALHLTGTPCDYPHWMPTISGLDANGTAIAQTKLETIATGYSPAAPLALCSAHPNR